MKSRSGRITHNKTKSKLVTKDKEGYFMMIKGSIHQEDIKLQIHTIQYPSTLIYEANIMKLMGETDINKIIVKDFNISPSITSRTSRQKINKTT